MKPCAPATCFLMMMLLLLWQVRSHGASMYFGSTVVTSWDSVEKVPQEVYNGGRSFLNCISETMGVDDIACTADNQTTCTICANENMGECRMVRARKREREKWIGGLLLLPRNLNFLSSSFKGDHGRVRHVVRDGVVFTSA